MAVVNAGCGCVAAVHRGDHLVPSVYLHAVGVV